jgi:peptidoglycan/xylan/chitin deacetylase (PgdA/CDA1 family)
VKPVRILPGGPGKRIYLTFDDGPAAGDTERVLEVLSALNVQATFFLVSQRAQAFCALVRKILLGGHAIGNHSLDHHYGAYFQGRTRMLDWIRRSEDALIEITGGPSVGFRPPAGIRTPELHWALNKLGMPLILWSVRFYDSTWGWNTQRALRSLPRTKPGSIVLLHDAQKPGKLPLFLKTLQVYIHAAGELGFEFHRLTRSERENA